MQDRVEETRGQGGRMPRESKGKELTRRAQTERNADALNGGVVGVWLAAEAPDLGRPA